MEIKPYINSYTFACFLCAMLGTLLFFAPISLKTADAATISPINTSAVEVWWPTDGATLSGVQPFKGLYKNNSLNSYSMYWQVDGGGLVQMYDSYVDYPHKEAIVDVSGWNWKGKGPYVLTFVIKDSWGNIVAAANRTIYINSATGTNAVQDIFSILGKKLYVNSNSSAKQQADQWRLTRPSDAVLMDKIANSAQATWLGGWFSDADTTKIIQTTNAEAAKQGAVPTYVMYNIPLRDCGSYSAGGANSPSGYSSWITLVANAIGDAPAIVVLEPDALAQMNCLSSTDQNTRLNLLSDAVKKLKTKKNIAVYIDAGHSAWIDASTMSTRLKSANIGSANGFALNVSNYQISADSIVYGTTLSQKVDGKHFVIDTSRNGNGSNGEWCNPQGRALGERPTTSTGKSLVDAYLWVKTPGESDGSCNGGPSAGTWWPNYALGLAALAKW